MTIDALPYLHALGDGGPRSLTQMIVIHATDNTASAAAEASYATHRSDKTSAHFYVDDTSAYRALPVGNIAYGCFPTGNSRSVQFELCGLSNKISDATMRQAAPLVAEVAAKYNFPIVRLLPASLRAGSAGICGHADVTAAWGEGDHTDPGSAFGWDTFIGYVKAAAGGDDMAGADADYAATHVPVPGQPGAVQGSHVALGKLLETSAALLAAVGKIGQPTADQITAQANAIAKALIASNTNGLTAADHAAVQADLEAVLRRGVGPA